MNDRIAQALTKHFEQHRIVLWYDEKSELRNDFELLALEGVEKREIKNNEFTLKYEVLKKSPAQKFLLYREGPHVPDLNNWLLDIELSHDLFRTDQVALWLNELELSSRFAEVIEPHVDFMGAAKRRDYLHKLLHKDDSPNQVRLKMLAVCAASEDPRLDSVVFELLQEHAEERIEKIRLIERSNLEEFLWEQLGRAYGYRSEKPGIQDFVIELFKSTYAMGVEGEIRLNTEALVFLKRWKDSRKYASGFEILSNKCADILAIETDLLSRDFRDLMIIDYFKMIDQKMIVDLVRAVVNKTVSSGDVSIWVRQRRQSHWYSDFEHLYEAVDYAARFLSTLNEVSLRAETLAEGVERYAKNWYLIDQLYRKFIFHAHVSAEVTLLAELSNAVENYYSNQFLLKLGDHFQEILDASERWDASPCFMQNRFYSHWVAPFLHKENRVCVVISDALRYEVGEELMMQIRKEDRYSAEIEPAVSMLPSYTQLGMAALLPHQTLELKADGSGAVLADGKPTQGTANRAKILKDVHAGRGDAIKSDEFMRMSRDEARGLLKDNDVIYIYHNRIDHAGDKLLSEGKAFEAAGHAIDDIIQILKKLTSANANNILITADHGFIYQNRSIDESDFLATEPGGEEILYKDRRFVLGRGLNAQDGMKLLDSMQAGLIGEMQIQLPKSINRLRLKGSGSRFVHGGASLQEVVIPVIKVNKKRVSDTSQVEIEVIRGGNSVITTGQLGFRLYQTAPVSEKVQARTVRVGLYTLDGRLISDVFEMIFDLVSENPREREIPVSLLLSRKADEANNQEVVLKLSESVGETTHEKEYKSYRYTVRRSFTSDFDF